MNSVLKAGRRFVGWFSLVRSNASHSRYTNEQSDMLFSLGRCLCYVAQAAAAVARSRLPQNTVVILITDQVSFSVENSLFDRVIYGAFSLEGLLRKTELWKFLPSDFEVSLFLDADPEILDDIEFGFELAARFGCALVPAPHYGLGDFFGVYEFMIEAESNPMVIFSLMWA